MNFDQPKNENIKTPDIKTKEGVDFVFEQNPELVKIGTKERYSGYLDTIFPNSKEKNIWYHGTNVANIDRLRISMKGTYGPGVYLISKYGQYQTGTFGENTIAVITNTQKTINYEKDATGILQELRKHYENIGGLKGNDMIALNNELRMLGYDSLIVPTDKSYGDDYLLIFDSKNTYILGSKQDIENFRKFVSKKVE